MPLYSCWSEEGWFSYLLESDRAITRKVKKSFLQFRCAKKNNIGFFVDGDETTTPGFFGQLPYDEDFGILLFRIGTASLEATGLRGWRNEVAPIPLPVKSNRNPNRATRGKTPDIETFGVVRMGRMDVGEVQYGSTSSYYATTTAASSGSRVGSSSSKNPYEDLSVLRRRRRRHTTQFNETQRRQRRGLFNEVRTVDLGVDNTTEPPGPITGMWRQIKQSWPFFVALWNVLTGLLFLLWNKARSRRRKPSSSSSSSIIRTSTAEGHRREEDDQSVDDDDNDDGGGGAGNNTRRMDGEKEVYSRFLRGEEISDDDDEHDDDFSSSFEDEDSRRGVEDDNDDLEEEEDDEEDDEEEEGENGQSEAVRLFSDFLRNGGGGPTTTSAGGGGGGGEMVLAHLLHRQTTSSGGPLTRQGWRELIGQGDASDDDDYRSQFRNHQDDAENDNSKNNIWDHHQPYNNNGNDAASSTDSQPVLLNTAACVVCMSGQRDIICWPCRYVPSSFQVFFFESPSRVPPSFLLFFKNKIKYLFLKKQVFGDVR